MSRRDIAIRVIGGAAAVAVLAWFAHANSGVRVDVDFLLFRLRDVSLSVVMYGSVILGMLLVLAVGLRADLRVRRQLRETGRLGTTKPLSAPGSGGEEEKVEVGRRETPS